MILKISFIVDIYSPTRKTGSPFISDKIAEIHFLHCNVCRYDLVEGYKVCYEEGLFSENFYFKIILRTYKLIQNNGTYSIIFRIKRKLTEITS